MTIIRKLDSVGRLLIPKEIRAKYNWDEHVELEFVELPEGVKLQKVVGENEEREAIKLLESRGYRVSK